MGYADITTTMNIYAEATKEKKQQAMANLNGKMVRKEYSAGGVKHPFWFLEF